MTLEVGKLSAAFFASLPMSPPTRSCSILRSLVPVCNIMCAGEPNSGSERYRRASSTFGLQSFDTLSPGNSTCSWRNFPFESIRIATSAVLSSLVVVVVLCLLPGVVVAVVVSAAAGVGCWLRRCSAGPRTGACGGRGMRGVCVALSSSIISSLR